MHAPLTDEEMIRQVLPSQPNQCFEMLYKRYVSKVYSRCLSMTQDSEKAQDFTHDIFIKVFDKLDAFQQRSSFSTWLYSIAYNYCADQLRLAKRLPMATLETSDKLDLADSPQDHLQEDALQVVQQAMATLSDKERSLLTSKYEDGMSIEAIAQLYRIKPSAVKMRLKRSREKIQALCAQHYNQ